MSAAALPDLLDSIRALLRAVEGGADHGTIRKLCSGEQDSAGRFTGGLLDLLSAPPGRTEDTIAGMPVSLAAKVKLAELLKFLLYEGAAGFRMYRVRALALLGECLDALDSSRTCDEADDEGMRGAIREKGDAAKPDELIRHTRIQKSPGLAALRRLEARGEYRGFARAPRQP
jgi:hypothetical protein